MRTTGHGGDDARKAGRRVPCMNIRVEPSRGVREKLVIVEVGGCTEDEVCVLVQRGLPTEAEDRIRSNSYQSVNLALFLLTVIRPLNLALFIAWLHYVFDGGGRSDRIR